MQFKKWVLLEKESEDKVRNILNNSDLCFFFKRNDNFFGTGEDGRITFAKIKNPDEDDPEGWEKEANFTAYDIEKLLNHESGESIISKKDIKNIKVIDIEQLVKEINAKTSSSKKIKTISFGITTTDS